MQSNSGMFVLKTYMRVCLELTHSWYDLVKRLTDYVYVSTQFWSIFTRSNLLKIWIFVKLIIGVHDQWDCVLVGHRLDYIYIFRYLAQFRNTWVTKPLVCSLY